jgi:hypothetical protein
MAQSTKPISIALLGEHTNKENQKKKKKTKKKNKKKKNSDHTCKRVTQPLILGSGIRSQRKNLRFISVLDVSSPHN